MSARPIRTSDPTGDHRLMARSAAFLFAAGATLALLSVVLPHPASANERGVFATITLAYGLGLLIFLRSERISTGQLQLAMAAATALVSAGIYFNATESSPYVLLYIWVGLYASYFFRPKAAALQIALIGLAYVFVPVMGNLAWWLLTLGTVAVTGGLIIVLRQRIMGLIGRLEDVARFDSLTGLLNRRGFREAFDLELERARRTALPLTLVVGDLDGFQAVNEGGGHGAGDGALLRVAAVLGLGERQIDTIARTGGDRFALLLPGTDEHRAYIVAERVRYAVSAEFATDQVPFTISLGIATFAKHGETASALLSMSDKALFAAKQLGGDRAVIYSAEISNILQDTAGREHEAERYLATVLELAEAVDNRYYGSARHSETVGRYAEMMARELGMSEHKIERVRLAGILHDVGKVCVPASIVGKPGKLTAEEWPEIKRHPELGAEILEHPSLADIRGWVLDHHERPDGQGYMRGLSAGEISLEAKILAVADAYEAMTADRSYQAGRSPAQARQELVRCAGSQFDEEVVKAFLRALEREAIRAERISS